MNHKINTGGYTHNIPINPLIDNNSQLSFLLINAFIHLLYRIIYLKINLKYFKPLRVIPILNRMITTSITTPSEVISNHVFANVLLNNSSNQKSLHAAVHFTPGDLIGNFVACTTQSYATYLTVQTGADSHITLLPEFLQNINNSCAPNIFFNTTTFELICLQPIQPGDEFTYFYPSTEWEMAKPFICNCGSTGCIQLINGASHLSVETLSKYKLTDFIRQQVRQKLSL